MNSFKPGDWIKSTRYPNLNPIQIESIYESNTRPGILGLKSKGTILYSDEVKLWQPKVGEWCWFYKEQVNLEYAGTHWAIPYLGRFGKFTEQGVQTIENFCYSFCEPFIGQLPTFIKDQS